MVFTRHEHDGVQSRAVYIYPGVAKQIESCRQHCSREEAFCRVAEIAEHRTDKHVDEE